MDVKQEEPICIFFSYAREDERLLHALEKHLASLKNQGLIANWYPHKISPGKEQAQEVQHALSQARIILLLISANFLASDYCFSVEVEQAMERHHTGNARVIPILLRPSNYQGTPFEALQPLPTNGKPITSWSKPDAAFQNVAEGIRTVVEELKEQSIQQRTSPVEPLRHIPYERNHFFTGREEILSRLTQAFQATNALAQIPPQAISGLGGIGKTQTALEYAYRHQDNYQFILWTTADRHETLVSDFVTIASLLNLPEKNAQDQSLTVNAVKRWLSSHKNWLLIFDNADDIAVIRDFIPSAYNGHILLTTRIASLPKNIARPVEIKPLTPEEGARFLLHRVNMLQPEASLETVNITDLNAAKSISDTMGGLPLALEQAGAYIDEMGCGLERYLKLYNAHHAKLLGWQSESSDPDQKTVATTWSLALEKVKHNEAAAELLELFAFLHPDTIYQEIITIAAPFLSPSLQSIAEDEFELNNAIRELRKYSLIHRTPDASEITIHRLMQTVIKDRMDKGKQHDWAEKTVKIINKSLPNLEFKEWPQYQRYLPHAQICRELILEWKMALPEAARLLNVTGKYLCERANYAEAQQLLDKALELREQVLGNDHPDVADTLNSLVELYRRQGRYVQALPLCQRALTIQESVLGPDHINVASSLNNLARLHHHLRKEPEAEQFYRRALTIRRQVCGENHPDVAESLNDLAALYSEMSREEKARELHQQALSIRKQALGELHPDVALSLSNLARCYKDQGKYVEAENLHKQALSIRKQALGELHPDVADSLNNLANCYKDQGKYVEAETLYGQALSIRKQALGELHPDVADDLNDLADCYKDQTKYVEAETLYRQALSIRKQALGEEHPNVSRSLNDLAVCYVNQGKYVEAENLHEQALSIRKEALGEEHPAVAHSLNNLAVCYVNQGKYVEAENFHGQALSIRKQALGEQHPQVATSLSNLANCYEEQGKYVQAEDLYEQALSIRKQALGEQHPDVAHGLNDLASCHSDQGKYIDATLAYKQAKEILIGTFGEDSYKIAVSLEGLAFVLLQQGDYTRSKQLFEQALTLREKAFGNNHPSLDTSLQYLARINLRLGHPNKAGSYYQRVIAIYKQTLIPDHPKRKGAEVEYAAIQVKMRQQRNKHKK